MRAFKVMGWAWLLKVVVILFVCFGLLHFVLNYLTMIIFTISSLMKAERKGGDVLRSHANCTNDSGIIRKRQERSPEFWEG